MPAPREYCLWGRRPSDPEWAEVLLTATTDPARIEQVKTLAAADGFVALRVSTFDPGEPVDFAATLNLGREVR